MNLKKSGPKPEKKHFGRQPHYNLQNKESAARRASKREGGHNFVQSPHSKTPTLASSRSKEHLVDKHLTRTEII
jgi:hypothetical protein